MDEQLKFSLKYNKSQQYVHLFLLGTFAIFRLFFISPLFFPVPGRDQGVFLLMGREILQGKIPYRDIWDHKGPIIYYINSLGLWLGNGSPWGVWWLEVVVILFAVISFYYLIRGMVNSGSAFFASLVWLIGFSSTIGGNLVEEYVILVNLAIIYIFLKRHSNRTPVFLLGFFAGIGVLFRPNEISYSAAALLLLLIDFMRKRNIGNLVTLPLYFLLGFSLPVTLASIFFIMNGALNDFISAVVLFNLRYIIQGTSVLWAFEGGLLYLFFPILLAGLSTFLIIRGKFRILDREKRELFLFALISLAMSIPLSVLSGRAYPHYYISWLFPLAMLAGFIPYYFLQNTSFANLRSVFYAKLLVWVFVIIGVSASLFPSMEKLYTSLVLDKFHPAQNQAVIDIDAKISKKEYVLMWGNETSYLLAANRNISSRYVYLTPLLTPGYGESIADEYLANIIRNKPVILDTSSSDKFIPSLGSSSEKYPWLEKILLYIRQNYEVTGQVGDQNQNWTLWRHK